MASAHDLAALMTAALTPPSGNGDVGFHQGVVLSWDELSGVNTIRVNGTDVSNVKTFQSGVGIAYFANDVVGLFRFQSTYFVLGKISAPGGNNANQIKSDRVSSGQSTASTSYGDLTTVGPTVTASIGSSRRCLVLFSANITSLANAGTPTGIYVGGTAAVQISGASSISPNVPYCGGQVWYASATAPTGFQMVSSQIALLTSADGLNSGLNNFQLKYRAISTNPGATFSDRSIAVIPF